MNKRAVHKKMHVYKQALMSYDIQTDEQKYIKC